MIKTVIIVPCMAWIMWRMWEIWYVWTQTPVVFQKITEQATAYVFKWHILPAVVLIVAVLLIPQNKPKIHNVKKAS